MPARASMLTVIALVAASALALATSGARADEPRRVELTWTADPPCPSRASVVSEVERLVRGSPPKDLIVASAVVEHDGSWRVRLETRSGDRVGKREVEAESCAQLADATAVILALMIDPSAALREKPEQDAPRPPASAASEPAAPRAPAPTPVPPVPAPRRPAPRLVGVIAASALGDVGTLPGPAPGVGVSDGIVVDAYRVTADLSYFPSRRGLLAQRPSAGGDFTLLAGALVGCRVMLRVLRARGALCLGAELDAVLATGFGVSSPGGGSTRWGALLAGTLVEVPIVRPVSAELRVAGIVPFGRPPFYFDDIGTVYRPSVVGLRLALGLAAHF